MHNHTMVVESDYCVKLCLDEKVPPAVGISAGHANVSLAVTVAGPRWVLGLL